MNCLKIRLFASLVLGMSIGSNALAIEPLHTNGASFRIPFAVDQSGASATGVAVLFASKDGAAMEPVQRVSAREGNFHFLAPSDGTFQFAVRMMNAQGKMIGEGGPLVPELEVIVDSKPPTISLALAETAPGEVVIKWSFSEPHVASETLNIEYLESSTGTWKPVSLTPGAGRSSLNQATIKSNAGQSVAVRASVKDMAGNVGSGTGQIVLSQQGSPTRHGSASGYNNHVSQQQPPSQAFEPFLGHNPAANTTGAFNTPPANSTTILGTSPFSLSDEAPRTAGTNQNASPRFHGNESSVISMPQPAGVTPKALAIPAQPFLEHSAATAATEFQPISSPQIFDANPNVTNDETSGFGYRAVERQHLNNRLFDLAYEIDSVGPSGVGLVVLYITENNGRNWYRYGEDKDKQSPFKVDTRGEGTFGFAVRVHNGVGFSDPPPQPGEVPSIVVTIDQTPPALRMSTPELSTQGQGTIRLRWDLQEANPADSATRLEYSTSSEGPWSPVFDWQQNPSGFEMPIDRNLPPAVHFRLLARDKAGNVSTTQTGQPVLIDRKRPKARVLSVKPATATPGY